MPFWRSMYHQVNSLVFIPQENLIPSNAGRHGKKDVFPKKEAYSVKDPEKKQEADDFTLK